MREPLQNYEHNFDMWIPQFLLRHLFAANGLVLGDPVCSEFKKYQNDREDVYFIHK